jgi:hypothetical protein
MTARTAALFPDARVRDPLRVQDVVERIGVERDEV